MNGLQTIHKILMSVIIICVIISGALPVFADPSGDLYSIYGYVLINSEYAPAGVEVTLKIQGIVRDRAYTTESGRYTLDFMAIQGDIAMFTVYIDADEYVPLPPSYTISGPGPAAYYLNLSVEVTGENQPPYTPSNPYPSNGATNVYINEYLSWTGGDPNGGDTVTYDVYFGTTSSPSKVSANQTTTSYNPGIMNRFTMYYWKIVAWDNHGAHTLGSLWSFRTVAEEVNNPPNYPYDPHPTNGQTNVDLNTDLSWTGGDPDLGDTVTYDVFFGTTNPPTTKVAENQSATSYDPGTLVYSTLYYWRVVAWDDHGSTRTSPQWMFTTQSSSSSSEPPLSTTENLPPIADATAGEPYQGFIDEDIIFNGSRSYDPDGTITSLHWMFGDGTNDTGKIVTHAYTQAGTYTVTLTVTDNNGASDSNTTTAVIVSANQPPNPPTVTGPTTGKQNESLEFTAVSTDFDNDTIQYVFTWGDGETTTSEFLPNGTQTMQTHEWGSAGRFIITVKAFDNQTDSLLTTQVILIDGWYVHQIGYLLDSNSDGTYDVFYSNSTGNLTDVEKTELGYLIDVDGDGVWDYLYDPDTDQLTTYTEGGPEPGKDYTAFIGLGVILILLLVALVVLVAGKKRKKPVEQPPAAVEQPNKPVTPKKAPQKKTGKKTK
ncbi:MAG: PKD domain-containing protein [Methanobacteriota archaeon]